MNENQTRELLHRGADTITVGPAPHTTIVRRARQRRTAALGVACAAAIALTGGGIAVKQLTDDARGPVVRDPLARGSQVMAPTGSRLAGAAGVVVVVPEAWSTGDTRCLKPVGDTVYFEAGVTTRCADEPSDAELRAHSSLAVSTEAFHYGFIDVDGMGPAVDVGGVTVRQGELECSEEPPTICHQELAVPSEGVAFRVTVVGADARGVVAGIRDSLQLLPEGSTTIPLAIQDGFTPGPGMDEDGVSLLVETLERAGFAVTTARREEAGLAPGSFLETDPALGSPARPGDTVTVTVSS